MLLRTVFIDGVSVSAYRGGGNVALTTFSAMSHRVAVLVFPGFQLLDAAGPIAAFEVSERYALRVIAVAAGDVRSSSGVAWVAEGLPRATDVDTLLVSGGPGVDAALTNQALLRFVRRVAARSHARVASVCSGSLLLGAAGLLDGRSATTHWSRRQQFERQFPNVKLDADRIFVRQGSVWTSAGVTAGIDLAVAMIAEDHGQELARAVAQELVVYYRRPGGQSQFSSLSALQGSHGRFDSLLDHVRSNLRARLSVEDLADHASMSPRHFAREFRARTGVTPAKAVERVRVEAARTALENGAASVQRVALDCGFGDVERMRRSFTRLLGMPPSALRRSPQQEA